MSGILGIVQAVALAAIWFWCGKQYAEMRRAKNPSTYEVFGRDLVKSFRKLKSNMRFVGDNPDIRSFSIGEYTFGDLGVVKITMEPVAPSPMTDAVMRGI